MYFNVHKKNFCLRNHFKEYLKRNTSAMQCIAINIFCLHFRSSPMNHKKTTHESKNARGSYTSSVLRCSIMCIMKISKLLQITIGILTLVFKKNFCDEINDPIRQFVHEAGCPFSNIHQFCKEMCA